MSFNLNFLAPKRPLFTLEIELEDIHRSVLDKGDQVLQLKHGVAYAGKEKAGRLPSPIWNYVNHFGFAKYIKRTGYNYFNIELYGEEDRSLIVPDPGTQPKLYKCPCGFPYMIPHEEYLCSLVDRNDHIDVLVGGEKIAEYSDKKIETLRKQLGWKTTAQFEPMRNRGFVYICTRK